MFKLRREHMEAFRPVTRAQLPHRVLADLQKQGVRAERDPKSGEVVATDARGFATRLAFYPDGLPARLTQPSGAAYQFEHNEQGRLAATTYPTGERLETERDARGNVREIRRPGLLSYNFEHDANDRPLSARYPDGTAVRFAYHPEGPIESLIDRTGAETRYERDADGRLQAIVDPLGRRTVYETESEGRLRAVVFPDGSRQEYAVDHERKAALITTRDGQDILNELDDQDRLRAIIWGDGSRTEFTFEGDNLARATNPDCDVSFTYDAAGNVATETTPAGTVHTTYDAEGRLLLLTTPQGESLAYEYDGDGRPSVIRDWEGRETRISYTPDGLVSEIHYGNGLIEQQQYPRVGRMARATVTDRRGRKVGEQLYEYDLCERLTGLADIWGDHPTQRSARRFEYDAESRLVAEAEPEGRRVLARYAYDAKGNLIQDNGTPVQVGPLDEPIRHGGGAIEYDRAGNARSLPGTRGTIRCSYAADGTLREAAVGDRVLRFEYDAFCRRIFKSDGRATWRYGWAGHQLLWEEYQESPDAPTVRRDYLFLPASVVPLAFREGGRTWWLQTDTRGAVIRAFDEEGSVAWRAAYDSFGAARVDVAKIRQPWRLAGQYEDEETGLHYNLARYYSPWLKSYLSRDPSWHEPGATNYSYARNDPWNRVDPFGAIAPLLAIGIIALGAVAGGVVAAVTGGDPIAGAVGGAIAGAGVVVAAVAAVGAVGAAVISIAASGVGGFTESIIEQVRRGDPISFRCAFKAALQAMVIDAALLGLGKIPGVKQLVKAVKGKLAALGKKMLGKLVKAGSKALKKIAAKLASSAKKAAKKLASRLKQVKCKTCGEPVDVGSGSVLDNSVDLALPGVIPLSWERHYASSASAQRTTLGIGGFFHSFEQWVEAQGDGVTLRDEEGRDVFFPPIAPGNEALHRAERLVLRAGEKGAFEVYSLDTRLTRHFAPLGSGGRAVLQIIRDPHGNEISLHYEDEKLGRIVDTAGREVRLLTSQGRIDRVEIWARGTLQQWVDYAYHPTGELAGVTDALGNSELYEYDARHRMVKKTFPNGVSFYYRYDDATGWCVETWGDNELHTVRLSPDLARRTTVIGGTEEPRIFTWNTDGMVIREETPDGSYACSWTFDADQYLLVEENGDGGTTFYEYDERGNRIGVTDPAGNETAWTYLDDLPAKRIDSTGLATQFSHTSTGTLTEISQPTGEVLDLEYDVNGRLAKVARDGSLLRSFIYDSDHNLIQETDVRGAVTSYTYDSLGRATSRTDALGRTTQIRYDGLGRPIERTNPDGTVTRSEYDVLGNPSRVLDPLGQETRLEYGGTGVLTRLVQPDGTAWSMVYDRDERLREIHNPAREIYRFDYDQAGRTSVEKAFDGRSLTYGYSRSGALTHIQYPGGSWRSFSYDALGNVTEEQSPDAVLKFRRNSLGQIETALVEEATGTVRTELSRDRFGRVIAESQDDRTIRYGYDKSGRRTERTLPDGSVTRYEYDLLGEPIAVEHNGRRVEFDLDVIGRETRRQAAWGGIEVHSAYDAMDRIVESTASSARETLSRRTWQYDALGRLTELADSRWGTAQYEYDPIGQLIQAKRGKLTEVFEYDPAQSLRRALSSATRGAATTWDVAPGNLLTRTGSARYEYDERCRRTRKIEVGLGATEYSWDSRDRLREVRKPDGERLRFTYDAFGRRVKKEVLAAEVARRTVEFIWDGDVLATEISSPGGTRVFVHEPESFIPLLQAERGEVFLYVNDHLATPRELIDSEGRVAWSASYTAWGRVDETWQDPETNSSRSINSPFRMAGQYADEETGLCYTRFRYFDPEVARWCSPDPLGIAGGINLYGFEGSPTNSVDPYGLMSDCPKRALHPNQITRGMEIDPKKVNVYRGGSELNVEPKHIKIDQSTGLVKTTHGLSLDVDAKSMDRFGGAHRIESIPPELKIIQRGGRLEHFEIVPREPMSPDKYQQLLNTVKLTPGS